MEETTAQQKEYEAALGRFLVSFNALEGEVNEVIELAFAEVGYPTLAKGLIKRSFENRLQLLQTLAKDDPRLQSGVHDRLIAMGQRRNELAHASILLIEGQLRVLSSSKTAMPAPEIDKLTAETMELAEAVSVIWLRLQTP